MSNLAQACSMHSDLHSLSAGAALLTSLILIRFLLCCVASSPCLPLGCPLEALVGQRVDRGVGVRGEGDLLRGGIHARHPAGIRRRQALSTLAKDSQGRPQVQVLTIRQACHKGTAHRRRRSQPHACSTNACPSSSLPEPTPLLLLNHRCPTPHGATYLPQRTSDTPGCSSGPTSSRR